MAHFVGLDVSVKETSVCVVDDVGKVILEQKVPTEPAAIIALLTSLGATYGRIGIEAFRRKVQTEPICAPSIRTKRRCFVAQSNRDAAWEEGGRTGLPRP